MALFSIIRKRREMISSAYGSLILDRQQFYPGEKVRGQVILSISQDCCYQGVEVKPLGTLHTFSGPWERNLLSLSSWLVGRGNSLIKLREGKHKFNFDISLPSELPCTFEDGYHGSVRYSAELKVSVGSRQGCIPVVYVSVPFQVIPRPVLWKNELSEPLIFAKEFSSMLGQGKVYLQLRTKQRGFEPGGTIGYIMNAKNRMYKDIAKMSVQVLQCIKYTATNQEECNVLGQEDGPRIRRGTQIVWNGSITLGKTVPPNDFGFSKQIEINLDYKIRIIVHTSGSFVPNLKGDIPITIGSPRSAMPTCIFTSESSRCASPKISDDSFYSTTTTVGERQIDELCTISSRMIDNVSLPSYEHAMRKNSGLSPLTYNPTVLYRTYTKLATIFEFT